MNRDSGEKILYQQDKKTLGKWDMISIMACKQKWMELKEMVMKEWQEERGIM